MTTVHIVTEILTGRFDPELSKYGFSLRVRGPLSRVWRDCPDPYFYPESRSRRDQNPAGLGIGTGFFQLEDGRDRDGKNLIPPDPTIKLGMSMHFQNGREETYDYSSKTCQKLNVANIYSQKKNFSINFLTAIRTP
jgi:hypothetical protein